MIRAAFAAARRARRRCRPSARAASRRRHRPAAMAACTTSAGSKLLPEWAETRWTTAAERPKRSTRPDVRPPEPEAASFRPAAGAPALDEGGWPGTRARARVFPATTSLVPTPEPVCAAGCPAPRPPKPRDGRAGRGAATVGASRKRCFPRCTTALPGSGGGVTAGGAGGETGTGAGVGCGSSPGSGGIGGVRGRKSSGSTYPCGSELNRTPRWTYGSGSSGSPLGPTVPTTDPSETASPRRTL
jgi:hypothetical protein